MKRNETKRFITLSIRGRRCDCAGFKYGLVSYHLGIGGASHLRLSRTCG